MRRGKTGYPVEESVRGSVSVDALQKLRNWNTATQIYHTDGKTDYAVEESAPRPETGGMLEKAMELVQSHSQRILSYSSSRGQHALYCWGALIGVTTWTVHSYMYIW